MSNGLPSGEQIDIHAGGQRVVVVEVGGGLRSYTTGDRELLDGYGEADMATAGRGQVLIPWPNRIRDGTYEFAGRTHHLPLTEPEAGNAIHGLVRWAAWSVAEREADRVVMAHTLHPQPGYPFSLDLSIEYSVSDEGLRVASTATTHDEANVIGDCRGDGLYTERETERARPARSHAWDHRTTDCGAGPGGGR